MNDVPVINLNLAPGKRSKWTKPLLVIVFWHFAELLLVTNPLQFSSRLRVSTLRLFGAQIGRSVVFRPRTRVKCPWNLVIGDRCWIGEGVWFHNQDKIIVGSDVAISQETMFSTGSHAHRRDMALITKPIIVRDGVWITSRCLVLGGSEIGKSSVIRPLQVVTGYVPSNSIWQQNGPQEERFKLHD